MNLCMTVKGQGDVAIPKGSHVFLVEEPALGYGSGFHVVFDRMEGEIRGHQVVVPWHTFQEMKDMSHLKKGKLYRFEALAVLHKDSSRSSPIGRIPKDSVVMFLEQSSRVAYTLLLEIKRVGWKLTRSTSRNWLRNKVMPKLKNLEKGKLYRTKKHQTLMRHHHNDGEQIASIPPQSIICFLGHRQGNSGCFR